MLNNSSRTSGAAVASLFAIIAFGFWLGAAPSLTPAHGAAAAPFSVAAAAVHLR